MASFDEIVSKMTAAIKGVREAVLGKDVREFIASGYESVLDAYKQLNTAVDSAASSAEKAKTAITEAIDPTLSVEGKAADAKTTGNAIETERKRIDVLNEGGLNLKDDVIDTSIKAWLTEHPEATTTVQDGTIGFSKLTFDLKKTINETKTIKGLVKTSDLVSQNTSSQIVDVLKNGSVLYVDDDILLDDDIIFSGSNAVILGDGKINLNEHSIRIGNLPVQATTGTYEENQIVVESLNGLNVGDTICIGSDVQKVHTTIVGIDGLTLTVSDTKAYAVDEHIYIMPKTNFIIDGVTFESGSVTLYKNTNGATVRNCKFKNADLICGGTRGDIYNNYFSAGRVISLSLYSATKYNVHNNSVIGSKNCIRAQYTYLNKIKDNYIEAGTSNMFSVGIEICTETTGKDMCCYNIIDGNTVVNGQFGRPGSAVGGIHLNFHAYNNSIINNISCGNSIGIYLENDCCYNVISGNNCSNNIGYYGVGIELDWNCSGNVINGNTCNYNVGNSQAEESCGIEVRTSSKNPDYDNSIVGNTCCYNGKCGLLIAGNGIVIANNIIKGNGTSTKYNERGGILTHENLVGARIIANVIRDNASHGILIKKHESKSTSIDITQNYIVGQNAIDIFNADNISVIGNFAGDYISISGDENSYCHVVFITQNKMYNSQKNYTANMNYISGYKCSDNFINFDMVEFNKSNCSNQY